MAPVPCHFLLLRADLQQLPPTSLKSPCAKAELQSHPGRDVLAVLPPQQGPLHLKSPPPSCTGLARRQRLLKTQTHAQAPGLWGCLEVSLRLWNVMQPVQPRSFSSLLCRQLITTPPAFYASSPGGSAAGVGVGGWSPPSGVSVIQSRPPEEHIPLWSLQITLGFQPASLVLQIGDLRRRGPREWDNAGVQQ